MNFFAKRIQHAVS